MKKMRTLFIKDPDQGFKVTKEIDPSCMWVYTQKNVKPTQKFDGSACAIIDGVLYKRYDAKKGKQVPYGAIPCGEPDEITGHFPHWLKCNRDKPEDKYFFEAYDHYYCLSDGTYELCGEKINGNPEKIKNTHYLLRHGSKVLDITDLSYESIKEYLSKADIEGIVFHGENGEMCKIRKIDFGFKR